MIEELCSVLAGFAEHAKQEARVETGVDMRVSGWLEELSAAYASCIRHVSQAQAHSTHVPDVRDVHASAVCQTGILPNLDWFHMRAVPVDRLLLYNAFRILLALGHLSLMPPSRFSLFIPFISPFSYSQIHIMIRFKVFPLKIVFWKFFIYQIGILEIFYLA